MPGKFLQDVLPDLMFGGTALAGIAHEAHGQQNAAVFHGSIYRGGQVAVKDHVLLGGFDDLFLGILREALRMFPDDLGEDLLGQFPLALKGDQHRYFVPDIIESAGIIGL